MLKIKIPASKVAACIGLNPYCSIKDTILDLYQYKKLGFIEKLEVKKILNKASKKNLCKLLEISDNSSTKKIQKCLQQKISKVAINSKQEAKLLKSLENTELLKTVQSEINMRKGVLHEHQDLNRNSKMGTLLVLLKTCEIEIKGRTDGYCSQSECLVETKHRKNRLFGKVPLYERIQCEIYMRMFECSRCYHTETWNTQSNEKLLHLDDKLWDKIISGFNDNFLPRYIDLMYSE